MRLIDADVLVDVLRGFEPGVRWLNSQQELPLVPGFVAMELIQAAKNKRSIEKTTSLLRAFSVVWPSRASCNRAYEIYRELHLSHGLGLIDSLIAVTALERGASLLTFNLKHYRSIPELSIERPYSRT